MGGISCSHGNCNVQLQRDTDHHTKSEYWQKADTSVVIQTKTIETYDASKKL